MTTIYIQENGDVSANSFIGDGSQLTNLTIGNLGTTLVFNGAIKTDALGYPVATQYLPAISGGTGINTSSSTGVAKINSGTWSVSSIVNSDINSSASISRSKIASDTANYVLYNNGSGIISSEQFLSVSRGGTGADLSTVGAFPYVLTNTSGIIASNVQYLSTSTASSVMYRDSSNATAVNTLTVNNIISTNLSTTVNEIKQSPITQIPTFNSFTSSVVNTIQTTNNTATTILSYATTTDTVYMINCSIALGCSTSTDTGLYKFVVKVANNSGVLKISNIVNELTVLDNILTGTTIQVNSSATTILIKVVGLSSNTINWFGKFELLTQTF